MTESSAVPASADPLRPQQEDQHSEDGVHRPWRALVALVELLLAVAAGWAATWAWSQVVTTITSSSAAGTELTSRLYSGPWVAASVGFALVAGLLAVDIVRELVLALRARR